MRTALHTSALLSTTLSCALAMLVGAGLVNWLEPIDFLVTWVLAIGLILVALVPIFVEWKRTKLDLFNLKNVFLGYYVLQFGVWTLWILATDDAKFLGNLTAWEKPLQLALLCGIAGIITFHIGYSAKIGQSIARHLPYFSPQWNSTRLAIVTIVLFSLGIFSFHHIMMAWGGLEEYVSELASARVHGIRSMGYFLLMAWYFPTVCLLIFYSKAVESGSKKYYVLFMFMLVTVLGIGLSLGYRGFLILPVMLLVCFRHYLVERMGFRLKHVLLVLSLVLLLNVYTFYREIPLREVYFDDVLSNVQKAEFWAASGKMFLRRFSGIETLTLVIERTDTLGYGIDPLSYLLTFPIPRALWAEKATPVARFRETVYDDYAYRLQGTNTTLPGELYWNFHIAGVILGMFLAGVFCKACYSYLILHLDNASLLLYAVPLSCVFWFIEAPTMATAAFISMIGIMFTVVAFLSGFRLKRIQR